MDLMKLHKNAALTPKQRQQIQQRYATGSVSYAQLAQQFAVSRKTVIKWAKRTHQEDHSSAPKQHYSRVTDTYRQAIISYRETNPTHGPVRIERELRAEHGTFSDSTVRLILQQAKALKPPRPRTEGIPTGRYRTQMDVQHLPPIKGSSGPQYKISIIHLATRIKYSEIHDDYQSETIAAVFKRSMDVLPPFLSRSPITP
jgi:transposase